MKALFLLRHAKSSWDDPALEDHDRPLAPRGLRAAPRVGGFMAQEGLVPQAILCSTAERARQTCEIVRGCLPGPPMVDYVRELYLASAGGLLRFCHGADPDLESLMLVGHDPGMHNFANQMVGSGPEQELAKLAAKFPTGALAVFHLAVDRWVDVEPGTGRLEHFVLPRELD
ncbi:MAG: histidine phosphatase family protein [Alphaproteobacteria bacterium]|nr:histidine phosphatase family protein [Alphaproteobacteria bacterium]